MEPLTPVFTQAPPLPEPAAAQSAVTRDAPTERTHEPRRQRERRDRRVREPVPAAPIPTPDPPLAGHRRGVQPVRARDDDDRGVVGFGADTPAFLARPPATAGVDDG